MADKFNIDHVIIGPAGVYAVETKARRKPETGKGRSDARVVYDGTKTSISGLVGNQTARAGAKPGELAVQVVRFGCGSPSQSDLSSRCQAGMSIVFLHTVCRLQILKKSNPY